MAKPTVFIGSSREGKEAAEELATSLEDVAAAQVWPERVFEPSRAALEDLVRAAETFDFAALLITADDTTTSRNESAPSPRDNVVFELGLFMGQLGRHRTFIVYDKAASAKLPSDLAGITTVQFDSNRPDGNLKAAVRPACAEIRNAVRRFGPLYSKPPRETALDGGIVKLEERWGERAVHRRDSEWRIRVHSADVRVTYGRLEDVEDEDAAIVLPANEFFDDVCMTDARSALGAFVKKHFGDGAVDALRELIRAELAGKPSATVDGREAYEIGTCVFLDRPLESRHRLILTAATTDRGGTQGEISFVLEALKQIVATMRPRRLARVHLPLLGAGHGHLGPPVSLFAVALGLWEVLGRSDARHVKDVSVVVFEGDAAKLPPPALERTLTCVQAMLR